MLEQCSEEERMKWIGIDWIHTIWKKYLEKKQDNEEEEDNEESEEEEDNEDSEEEDNGWNTDMILDTLDGFRLAYRVDGMEGWYQYCGDEQYYYLVEEEDDDDEKEDEYEHNNELKSNEESEESNEQQQPPQSNPPSFSFRVVYSCLSGSHLEYLIKQVSSTWSFKS